MSWRLAEIPYGMELLRTDFPALCPALLRGRAGKASAWGTTRVMCEMKRDSV